jgi:hypothetical protein
MVRLTYKSHQRIYDTTSFSVLSHSLFIKVSLRIGRPLQSPKNLQLQSLNQLLLKVFQVQMSLEEEEGAVEAEGGEEEVSDSSQKRQGKRNKDVFLYESLLDEI